MNKNTFKLAAAAIAVASTFAGTAHAAGFMLTEQSVAGLGRSYAGIGVDGTDISGVYYNPATMTLHKGTILQAGFVGIGLNLDYVDHDGGENANGRDKSQPIPHGYILHQINDRTWFGLSMTVPFGMGTEYDNDWAQTEKGISAQVLTFDLNPNFAWKVTDKISVGAGVSVQYAAADLKMRNRLGDTPDGQKLGALLAGKPGLADALANGTVESEIDADSTAWGWNIGMMWSPLENLRFGLSYRSKITHKANGDLTIGDPEVGDLKGEQLNQFLEQNLGSMAGTVAGMMGTHPGEAVISTPAWAMATVAWDVNELLSLYGTFRWTDWSSFETLDITSNGAMKAQIENHWRDTYLGSLGADLRLTDKWTLRGGVAYESSPVADKTTRLAIIPDADRWWFSVGSSYKFTENLVADVAFAHLHGVHERSLWNKETGDELGKFRKLDAYLLGAQLQYKF